MRAAQDDPRQDHRPPRQRLIDAAADLFYRHGIRAVGVEAIAEAAGTNKMTLYRHFPSKDDLVAEYLREWARGVDERWERVEQEHGGNPRAQLRAWLENVATRCEDVRGCALANAAVELPDKDHPARRVVEECKLALVSRLAALCAAAGLHEPEVLADKLALLLEGARIRTQSIGPQGVSERFLQMCEAIIAAHEPDPRPRARRPRRIAAQT